MAFLRQKLRGWDSGYGPIRSFSTHSTIPAVIPLGPPASLLQSQWAAEPSPASYEPTENTADRGDGHWGLELWDRGDGHWGLEFCHREDKPFLALWKISGSTFKVTTADRDGVLHEQLGLHSISLSPFP